MGVEGLDTKYPRGKYPREAWPWDRASPHDDVAAYTWARPNEWDGISAYDGTNKLNTSIYELCAARRVVLIVRPDAVAPLMFVLSVVLRTGPRSDQILGHPGAFAAVCRCQTTFPPVLRCALVAVLSAADVASHEISCRMWFTSVRRSRLACSVVGQEVNGAFWPIANFEFPDFLHYYRASLVTLCAPSTLHLDGRCHSSNSAHPGSCNSLENGLYDSREHRQLISLAVQASFGSVHVSSYVSLLQEDSAAVRVR